MKKTKIIDILENFFGTILDDLKSGSVKFQKKKGISEIYVLEANGVRLEVKRGSFNWLSPHRGGATEKRNIEKILVPSLQAWIGTTREHHTPMMLPQPKKIIVQLNLFQNRVEYCFIISIIKL